MKRAILGLIGIGLLIVASCGRDANEETAQENRQEADALFAATLRLADAYIDSLKHTNDKFEVDTLFDNFNKALNSLNFNVTPDTDLQLSEGQNDTLFLKLQAVRKIYDAKLKHHADTTGMSSEDSITAGKVQTP